jgi:hypothetical protein
VGGGHCPAASNILRIGSTVGIAEDIWERLKRRESVVPVRYNQKSRTIKRLAIALISISTPAASTT